MKETLGWHTANTHLELSRPLDMPMSNSTMPLQQALNLAARWLAMPDDHQQGCHNNYVAHFEDAAGHPRRSPGDPLTAARGAVAIDACMQADDDVET